LSGIDGQLKDLVFELSDIEGFKLCLCVCDDHNLQLTLARQVSAHLAKKKIRSIELSPNVGDLVQQLKMANHNSDVAFLLNLDLLSEDAFDEQMNRLNFQRDALIRLGMPVSVWLCNDRLMRLATIAPDLWSRRTSTYQFSNEAINKLIQGLFINPPVESKNKGNSSSIVQTLNRLIAAEERLRQRSTIESPREDDPDVFTISKSIDELIASCKAGKSLEVALDLANLTRLDSKIGKIRVRYPSLPFGNMYDAILDMAPQIVSVLLGYKHSWFRRLLKGRKVSLISFFFQVAYGRVYQALVKSRQGPQFENLTSEELDSMAEAGKFGNSFASFENALAAKELIEWLLRDKDAGEIHASFTSTERELLRALVSTGINQEALRNIGIDVTNLDETLSVLRGKVADYLGIPSA
jgi:hypothetical protein